VSLFSQKLANGGTAGGRAAYNFSRHFSLEANYNFMVNNARLANSTFGNQIHSLAIDPVYNFTPLGARVRPYVTAGVGPIWFTPTKQARAQLAVNKSTEFAFNYGGGVKFHLNPHLGLRFDARGMFSRNPAFGLATIPKSHLNGLQTTLGLVFYFGQDQALAAPPPEPKPTPTPTIQPLNLGEITGADGQLCQGRTFTLHSTATDPSGRALAYAWKVNGQAVGTNNPDLAFTPNNAGDFQFEVEVSDANDPARIVRIGPKTLAIQDYTPPQIQSVTASPNALTIEGDPAAGHTVKLESQVAASRCGGNLTYKWTVSEGSLTNDAGPNALFDAASLAFDSGLGQTKTITALLTVTDEAGKSASQSAAITVNYPAQYKRLPDVIFANDSARVNNCGKRILIEQAAPQAGTAFDILLVGHRGSDERSASLDRQRALAAAAVLTGNHGVCASLDLSQVWMSAAGTTQISTPDPALCGTSNIPHSAERHSADPGEKAAERRVEVYLAPKGSRAMPPAAKGVTAIPAEAVKALGCPK
jgi:outer membrane protein OmpA-like peptidoglycan-associated protein